MQQRDKGKADERLRERLSEQEFGSLNLWCRGAKTSIRLDSWLDRGKTRAKVAVVYLRDNKGQRKVVLKYSPLGKRDFLDKEAFDMAAKSGPPGFAKAHLIALDRATDKLPMNGAEGSFILMKWPPGSKDCAAMSALRDSDAISAACKAVTKSILVDWNESNDVPDNDIEGPTPTDFIREIVGDKCANGGAIHKVARTLRLLSSPTFDAQNGQQLPNPFKAATAGSGLAGVRVYGIRGNAHGDLHPENILVRRTAQKKPPKFFEDYILIDLSTFSTNRLLAVDPVHLMMSAIAWWLKDLSLDVKNRSARYLLDPKADSSGIPSQLAATVRSIHKSGLDYAQARGLRDEWRTERLLAIIGCALLFAGRDFEGQDPEWFMQVAGMAVEALTGRPVTPDSSRGTESSGPASAAPADSSAAAPAEPEADAGDSTVVPLWEVRSPRALSAIERDVRQCLGLANELISAIGRIKAGLPSHAVHLDITVIPSIVSDLGQALESISIRVNAQVSPIPFDGAAAAMAQKKLWEISQLLDKLSRNGTRLYSLNNLRRSAAELRNQIQRILPHSHDGPHT